MEGPRWHSWTKHRVKLFHSRRRNETTPATPTVSNPGWSLTTLKEAPPLKERRSIHHHAPDVQGSGVSTSIPYKLLTNREIYGRKCRNTRSGDAKDEEMTMRIDGRRVRIWKEKETPNGTYRLFDTPESNEAKLLLAYRVKQPDAGPTAVTITSPLLNK